MLKTSKKLFLLTHLRRSCAQPDDLVAIYTAIIRPTLEYACPVWSTGLGKTLIKNIESIQRRALKIIYPNLSYADAMSTAKLCSLEDRRDQLCKRFFNKMKDNDNKLHHLLPAKA